MTALAAALLLWAVVARHRTPAAPPASIAGTYSVRVVGYGKGEGTCEVAAKTVDVDGQVFDDKGTCQRLKATGLILDGYRFRGDGALDGVPVRISGRIDPADAAAPTPRLSATFLAADGRTGRIVGTHD